MFCERKDLMNISPINPLTPDQTLVVRFAVNVMNSPSFEEWFLKARFTELGPYEGLTNVEIYNTYFRSGKFRFNWYLVKRPWYKRYSSVIGWGEKQTLYTYKNRYYEMSQAERAGHFAHELMHIIGFEHSFSPSTTRDTSLPYQVGDYVTTKVANWE